VQPVAGGAQPADIPGSITAAPDLLLQRGDVEVDHLVRCGAPGRRLRGGRGRRRGRGRSRGTLNKYGGTGATSLRQCFISGTCTYRSLGDSAYLAASCTYGGRSWSYPMTTRMMSAGAGEQCFGTYQCEYGLTCSAGRCQ